MKKLITTLLISMFLVIAASGCQEGNSSATDRQARLMGNENLKLKNTIKEKDAEIANLQSQILECEKKITALKDQSAKAGDGFMKIMMEINNKSSELEKQNELLKAKIKELEASASN